jgi:hypothetical protein
MATQRGKLSGQTNCSSLHTEDITVGGDEEIHEVAGRSR